jgi:hypothetical protein
MVMKHQRRPEDCFDPDCQETAQYELRGLRMCKDHYIEALDHGADFSFDLFALVGISDTFYPNELP